MTSITQKVANNAKVLTQRRYASISSAIRSSSRSTTSLLLSSTPSESLGSLSSTVEIKMSKRQLSNSITTSPTKNDNHEKEGDAIATGSNNKGFLKKLWDQYSPQGQQHRILMGERLFRAAQRQAMDPKWYLDGRISNEFRPRHALLTLHVWFLHRRLIADTIDPHKSLLIQEELFDTLWNDTRSRIRAEGLNELTINKHLKDVQQVTFQMCTHLDQAFSEYAQDSKKRFEEVAAVIWIHLLLKDEEAHDDHLKRLAAYVEYQFDNVMFKLPDVYWEEGRVGWVNIPNFEGMKDNAGNMLSEDNNSPELEELSKKLILPEGWLRVLTDAGNPYFWNTESNVTQWEEPNK